VRSQVTRQEGTIRVCGHLRVAVARIRDEWLEGSWCVGCQRGHANTVVDADEEYEGAQIRTYGGRRNYG
jgi:hypothetical protein